MEAKGRGWMEGGWMEAKGAWMEEVPGRGAGWWRGLEGGWLDRGMDGVEMRFGSRGSVSRVGSAVRGFAVHKGERFLAVRFRFAVRFAAV